MLSANYTKRLLSVNDEVSFFCVFGKDGLTNEKIEEDWKTPIGIFPIRKIYYRADRIENIDSKIECIPLSGDDAWCDDIEKIEYNKFVKLPFDGHHENLWRDDELYDIIVVLGYNDSPIIKNKGSAIFLHVAKENMEYTKGCLAIKKEALLKIIESLDPETQIQISL